MCELCDGETLTGCPDCGRIICHDIEKGDDIVAPMGVTSSGDRMCIYCARKYERLEEEEAEREGAYGPWPDDPDDPYEPKVSP